MASRKLRPIRVEGNIAYVPLTHGYEAIIDAGDVSLVSDGKWTAWFSRRGDGSIRTIYATRRAIQADGQKQFVYMHRLIAGTPKGLATDHYDGDGLNNRRNNLRAATTAQNMYNQGLRITNKSGVKGVSWDKKARKWRADISINSRKRHLGWFHTVGEAADAYAKASADLHGDFGRTA